MKSLNVPAAVATCLVMAAAAHAAPVTLTFEGLANQQLVGSYYAQTYGVTFSSTAVAFVSAAAGGSGRFENEPSPSTVMSFNQTSTMMNRAAGINGSLSFYYSSAVPGSVSIYDGLDGTGKLLASVSLINQATTGCPLGEPFCNWTSLGVNFAGTGRSVMFMASQARQSVFDNVSFDADAVVNPVPAPATGSLALAALGCLAVVARRRRHA